MVQISSDEFVKLVRQYVQECEEICAHDQKYMDLVMGNRSYCYAKIVKLLEYVEVSHE